MQEVNLAAMLDAREARVAAQEAMQAAHPDAVLVSFTLNIPGPIKNSPAIRRAFTFGCTAIEAILRDHSVVDHSRKDLFTGCEALWAVKADALPLKDACTALEDDLPLGRLFDIDILAPDGSKIERRMVGKEERGCMVCGTPGRGCASRRLHTVAELQKAAWALIDGHFAPCDAEAIGHAAMSALLDEVETTPKPGLVDRNGSGSHTDMDIDTFRRSAHALESYFIQCAALGMKHRGHAPETLFSLLRAAGLEAEKAMYAATNGINTHKGAIYTLGVLCGAVGSLWNVETPTPSTDALLDACAVLTRTSVEADLASIRAKGTAETAGERLYLAHGLTGIRGEAANGLPAVRSHGLPAFCKGLDGGLTAEEAGRYALLHLIAHTDDSTLWHRGGADGAAYARKAAADLLKGGRFPTEEELLTLDHAFTARRLSPGGSADLLAVLYFLHRLEHLF
ncbi:MAG: citrate lyase holo-[Clostridia bacterium]|nr:citrate lyase holo-[acyl-carrier protein] synthase [Clostridia bacterium]